MLCFLKKRAFFQSLRSLYDLVFIISAIIWHDFCKKFYYFFERDRPFFSSSRALFLLLFISLYNERAARRVKNRGQKTPRKNSRGVSMFFVSRRPFRQSTDRELYISRLQNRRRWRRSREACEACCRQSR